MNIQPDFEELLQLLEKHDVKYMIVGGYAVAFYGYPRFTKDIDIYYCNSEENVQSVIIALIAFGFTEKEFSTGNFLEKGNIITFGIEPVRVDMINSISGVDFEDAWKNKVRGKYGNTEVYFIGKSELMINKSSTGRIQDQADFEKLK